MNIKDSGQRTDFGTGSVRDMQVGKGRMDLLPGRALIHLSKLFEAGCLKYGDRNWEKGQRLSSYVSSGLRHGFKFLCGMQDEDHLVATCWNFMCCLDTLLRIREGLLPGSLDDLPGTPSYWEMFDANHKYSLETAAPPKPEPAPAPKPEPKLVPEYRPLTDGETIELGDEQLDTATNEWSPSLSVGREYVSLEPGRVYWHDPHRRPLTDDVPF